MIAEKVRRMYSNSKNRLVKLCETVCIPYHDEVDGLPPIPFYATKTRTKDPSSSALGISWNNGRSLLDKTSFSRWDDDGTLAYKNHNVNARFLFNG